LKKAIQPVQIAETRDGLGLVAKKIEIFCLRGTLAQKHALGNQIMPASNPPVSNRERIKFFARKGIILAATTILFGWLYGVASPWAFPKSQTAGFGYGMLHGAMMPLSLPSLVIGKDVEIYALQNSGRFYKIGYICGINLCGLAFFGPLFWRPQQKPK